MKGNVINYLSNFYKNHKEDILEYKEYACSFPTEYVERIGETVILDSLFEKTKILIMTANAVEQNILTHKLYNEVNRKGENKKLHEMSVNGFVYQFASVDEIEIVHMHPISVSSFTIGGAEDALQDALKRFRPELVVSLGVAFGVDCDNQELGDVLLSSGIIAYDVFQKNVDGEITIRSEDKRQTDAVLNAWDVLWRNKEFALEKGSERTSITDKELKFKWQYEMILSGGTVLSNEEYREQLLDAARRSGEKNVAGGEMEGVGVYRICQKEKIPCIVIKGICDWAAEKNGWENVLKTIEAIEGEQICGNGEKITNDLFKDCVQAYAMDHASEALLRLLRFDVVCLQRTPKHEKVGFHSQNRFNILKIDINNFPQLPSLGKCVLKGAILSFIVLYMINKFIDHDIIMTDVGKMLVIFIMCILWITIIIYEKAKIRPINHKNIWVEIGLEESYSQSPDIVIRLNDTRNIYNTVISNWKKDKRIKLWSEKSKDVIKSNTDIKCTHDHGLHEENVLQLDYQLANGYRYIHLFSRQKKESKIYTERIFWVKNHAYYYIGKRNGVIGTKGSYLEI